MKLRIKTLLLTLLAVGTMCMMTACGSTQTPYQVNDEENYSVSVKYDANGGIFTTNTSVIVDSYNITDMNKNASGQAEIALIEPDNAARKNDAFTATKSGYFLAGWYTERTEAGTDSEGNPIYTYANKWNFAEDVLAVDASKTYSAEEPVLTLYAAWIPMFEIQFYSLATGEYVNSYTYNPTVVTEIKVPSWDMETGAVEMYNFPENDGYTFNGAYLDEAGTQAVTTEVITHPGVLNEETGTVDNAVMKLYVDYIEGEWYHIYTAEQFVENASINGNYEIHADLDFTEENWPSSLMYGNFKGSIKGNGHKFSNITFEQTNNNKVNAGLFGALTEEASITDVTFENVTFTLKRGTRTAGAAFGLFAGSISEGADISKVKIKKCTLQIDSDCYFGVDDYSIGLLCGMGDASVVKKADITCVPTGDNADNVKITVEGNEVTVEIITQ